RMSESPVRLGRANAGGDLPPGGSPIPETVSLTYKARMRAAPGMQGRISAPNRPQCRNRVILYALQRWAQLSPPPPKNSRDAAGPGNTFPVPFRNRRPMSSKTRPVLANYSNYRQYLADYHAWRKESDPRFSVRQFAKEIGFSSHTLLRYLLDGKRNLSKRSLIKVSLALGLSGAEADFFENLVFFNQAESLQEKNHFYRKLLDSDKSQGLMKLEARQFEALGTWDQTAIREMINLGSFKPDPERIARQLLPPIDTREARESLKMLAEAGIVKKTANGYRAVDEAITNDDATMAMFVKNYHVEMMELAKRSLDTAPPEQRDISSVCFTIREADFGKLKKQIQLIRKELRVFAATGKDAERVVQVNIQLFPLSKE